MSECQHCCLICKYYENRSGFCRFNPPVPVAINDGNYTHTIAMWPKITAPNVDWCSNFSNIKNEREIL